MTLTVDPLGGGADESAARRVQSHLRALVLDGTLPPGSEFSQVELARTLGVSRTPLREALRMLEEEGLVEAEQNRKARISAGRRRACTCGSSSVEIPADPSPGKCFGHAAVPPASSPRAKASASAGSAKWREPSGPPARSRTGARSTSTPARPRDLPVALPAASASFKLPNDEAGAPGGSSSKVLAPPPSWSTKASVRRGRDSPRLQSWTITPATPFGAGRPETTTRAAFWRGVRVETWVVWGGAPPARRATAA